VLGYELFSEKPSEVSAAVVASNSLPASTVNKIIDEHRDCYHVFFSLANLTFHSLKHHANRLEVDCYLRMTIKIRYLHIMKNSSCLKICRQQSHVQYLRVQILGNTSNCC
jgi:hypothetical protein